MANLSPTLIERVEAASGADRELDARIWCIVSPPVESYTAESWFRNEPRPALQECIGVTLPEYLERWPEDAAKIADSYNVPKFTGSLDAAMLLVPEGWDWSLECRKDRRSLAFLHLRGTVAMLAANAATPALALVAACLKARAAQQPDGESS